MIRPVNINEKGQVVDLQIKRYQVFLLGGWGVKLRGFTLKLKNISTGEILNCDRAIFRSQAYTYNQRAKKIFVIDIKHQGKYEVEFMNIDTLEVKKSNLPIFSSFMSNVPNNELKILITDKIGLSPIIN